ncbi:selenium metabolism-associated LysR family transcriptional regulator [Desulforamulus hydrothermalis]|uniref:Transcriptional regulator, LysR family n=1 Tax=Desulforamulus hydrothermalis Lam5 = DSM 18033 TaxID=1121428 RepID=K8ELC6_9FIRM|nr:selenium metabolism-associated LysR family transcriptional regulator [Desulforamulus hydrothermalis]CCO09301.1 Transcriptional regulator, LysR family [Desulforamulus hydrothermalis Lam5 = DSM 18033]SHH04598.1 transcriptional regulator, LysR family [Desulforamulus hydrothermalis Lam5 = DSM 18033]
MNLATLQTFIIVAEKKNLSLAAQEIHITQPAISKQLSALESHFGAALVERKGRGISLTPAGEVFYRHAREIVDLINRAERDIRQMSGEIRGRMIVWASTIPGHYILPPIIGAFKKEYPDVQLVLQIGDSKEAIRKLLEESAHLAAVGMMPNNKRVEGVKFFSDELVVIVPPEHPLAARPEIYLQELAKYPLVWRETGSGTRSVVESYLARGGLTPDKLNIALELGSTGAVITAVEAGAGLSVVSRWAVLKEQALRKIVTIKIKDYPMQRDLYLVYPRRKNKSPLVEAFIQFALKQTPPA